MKDNTHNLMFGMLENVLGLAVPPTVEDEDLWPSFRPEGSRPTLMKVCGQKSEALGFNPPSHVATAVVESKGLKSSRAHFHRPP